MPVALAPVARRVLGWRTHLDGTIHTRLVNGHTGVIVPPLGDRMPSFSWTVRSNGRLVADGITKSKSYAMRKVSSNIPRVAPMMQQDLIVATTLAGEGEANGTRNG